MEGINWIVCGIAKRQFHKNTRNPYSNSTYPTSHTTLTRSSSPSFLNNGVLLEYPMIPPYTDYTVQRGIYRVDTSGISNRGNWLVFLGGSRGGDSSLSQRRGRTTRRSRFCGVYSTYLHTIASVPTTTIISPSSSNTTNHMLLLTGVGKMVKLGYGMIANELCVVSHDWLQGCTDSNQQWCSYYNKRWG